MSTESDKVKLTADQVLTIQSHNDRLIGYTLTGIEKIKEVPGHAEIDWCKNQLAYYRHCIAALRWSTGLAKQMQENFPNVV